MPRSTAVNPSAVSRHAGGMPVLDVARLEALVDSFDRVHLLVVGDLVLDGYVFGEADRVSPEAPVPVVRVREETEVLGGAANVVRNIAALGGNGRCALIEKEKRRGRQDSLTATLPYQVAIGRLGGDNR